MRTTRCWRTNPFPSGISPSRPSWCDVFRNILGPAERGYVGELSGHRNRWAYQERFSSDDAYRALDSVDLLLAVVSAPQSDELEKVKMELLRVHFTATHLAYQ